MSISRRAERISTHSGWRWPAVSVVALLLCLAFLVSAFAGTFRVRQVEVVGRNLPADEIVSAAGVTGENLFTVRSDQVVRRVSRIREIVVTRVETSFPDRVTIYARLRPTIVAWQAGRSVYELDPDGRIVRQVQATSLPIIRAPDVHGKPGASMIEAVRYAVQTLPQTPNGAVAAFEIDPQIGLVIMGRAGWKAEVGRGSPQRLVQRIATLAALLVKVRTRPQHLIFIDLRANLAYAHFSGA